MKLLKNSIAILLLLFIFSCNNDDDTTLTPQENNFDPTEFAQNFGSDITRTFLGTVIDKNENPIENVSITIGSSTASTDSNGVFIISDAMVHERFAYVKAEKAGYIHGSRAVVPSTGTNKVTIMLLDETVVGTTSSGMAETISLNNGASVSLQGNYLDENGITYNGSVDVIMHHLDPTEENMTNQMPGMLYAANANNEERMLQTFGMLAVELRGANGEDLNLAKGSTAEIKVPLDASLVANAPSTIPLWYFDEVNGYWIEDGQATLIGNEYIGTVSHFSFWNCDIPAEAINLCISVTDESDNSISNLYVTITSSVYGTRGGVTNENGEVCGLVPSNEVLEINVYVNDVCNSNSIYTGSIGPFSSDSSINISLNTSSDIISETVKGTFNSCDGNPVTEGYVQLKYTNQIYTDAVDNGDFEINLLRCANDNTFEIEAADYINLQTTNSINYTFTTPLTNIGTITACNTVNEFIEYSIDGNSYEFFFTNIQTDFPPSSWSNASELYIQAQSDNSCFYMIGYIPVSPPYEGTYSNQTLPLFFNLSECIDMSDDTNTNNVIYNLTAFGDVGEYIDINFGGDYEDFQGNSHTINGVIHVIRDN